MSLISRGAHDLHNLAYLMVDTWVDSKARTLMTMQETRGDTVALVRVSFKGRIPSTGPSTWGGTVSPVPCSFLPSRFAAPMLTFDPVSLQDLLLPSPWGDSIKIAFF